VTVRDVVQSWYWHTSYALVRIEAVVAVVGTRVAVVLVDRAMTAQLRMSGVQASLG